MEQNETKSLVGFLFINKPAGITSRDCINKLQRMLPRKTKIGHAGTLDKFATGLLIVGIGRPATRMFTHMIKLDKKYWVRAKIGELTNTLDYTGDIITSSFEDQVSYDALHNVFNDFPGVYDQMPPTYSALKWEGKRLSDLARSKVWQGKSVEEIRAEKTRTVHIYELNLITYMPPFVVFDTHVSHGTYIRALANDIAERCESVATTHELKRTQVGPFKLEDAIDLDQVESIEDIQAHLISVEQVERQLTDYIVASN